MEILLEKFTRGFILLIYCACELINLYIIAVLSKINLKFFDEILSASIVFCQVKSANNNLVFFQFPVIELSEFES